MTVCNLGRLWLYTKGLYECTAAAISRKELQKFRAAVLRGILGPKRGRMCAEVVFTLFAAGHLVDPGQAVHYQVLVRWHRMAQKRPDLHHLMNLTRIGARGQPAATGGPLGIARQAIAHIGASWISAFIIRLQNGREGDVRSIALFEWAHIVREELPYKERQRAAKRRNEMAGIETGVDREASKPSGCRARSRLNESDN